MKYFCAARSTEERHGHSIHDDRPLLHRQMRKDTVGRIGAQRQSEPGVGPKLRILPKEPGDGQGKRQAEVTPPTLAHNNVATMLAHVAGAGALMGCWYSW